MTFIILIPNQLVYKIICGVTYSQCSVPIVGELILLLVVAAVVSSAFVKAVAYGHVCL